MILRIAALLRNQFKLELQAHKLSFARLRQDLRKTSFISLWGLRLVLSHEGWTLIEEGAPLPQEDALVVRLDPHLEVLRDGFALPDALAARSQLDLFSFPNLRRAEHRPAAAKVAQPGRRRSA